MSENENSARPRCDFIYTKNSARPRSDFIYTKNFQEGRCDSCLTVSVLRVRFLCGNRWGDLEENCNFLKGKRAARWTDVDSIMSCLKSDH